MNEFRIGTYIRKRREELGLSQEELGAGICATSTLSRIENNLQDPSRNLTLQLLGRLSLPENRFLALWDQKSIAIAALMREINLDMVQYRRASKDEKLRIQEEIREKMKRVEEIAPPDDRYIQQLMLTHNARLDGPDGPRSIEEQLSMQLKAIKLTCPKFDPEDFQHGYYNWDECLLINQIANSYSDAGQLEKGIDIFRQLLWYIEKNCKELDEYAQRFTLIAHNYAIDLLEVEQYEKAAEIAEQGRKVCLYYGDYHFLPGFLVMQAKAYYFLGDKDKSKKLYYQAYYIYEAYEDKSNLITTQEEMKEYLGLEIAE